MAGLQRPSAPTRANRPARRRMLVFAINFAPEPTGAGVPTTRWAETLVGLGWDVTVVAGVPHYPQWKALPAPARCRHGSVVVLHRRHYVPRQQSAARRGAYELSWMVSAGRELLARRDVDAVLGVVPSLGGAALAATAARRFGAPFGLVFQDLVGLAAEQAGVPGGERVSGAVQGVERHLAQRAAGVAVVSDCFAGYLVDGGVDPARIHVVPNPACAARAHESRESVRRRLGWRPDEFVVLYSGSIGHKQGFESVLAAAALARRDSSLRFVLQGDGNRRAELQEEARRLGLANLAFSPLAPNGSLQGILAAADLLLLNQRGSVRNMAMPSKLASYFAAGVAVVAAAHPSDGAVREIVRSGAGVAVAPDDPHALLAAVEDLRSDPARLRRLGCAGARHARRQLETYDLRDSIERFVVASFEPARARKAAA